MTTTMMSTMTMTTTTTTTGTNEQPSCRIVEGSLYDESKLQQLVNLGCDVLTMENEHEGVDGLAKLESEGVNVQPRSRVVRLIQDKYAQKKVDEDSIARYAFAFGMTD